MKREPILKMDVNVTSMDQTISRIDEWVKQKEAHVVCVSNVHMCMEVYDDPEFADIVNKADKVIPDGKPLSWGLKLLGHDLAEQVRGADITLSLCEKAVETGLVIGLYGGSQSALSGFSAFLQSEYPELSIGCAISPPFRELSDAEDQEMIDEINQSDVQILFVGLGCPKQEYWMAKHKHKLSCVMLGVGAVFDFLSGDKREAPRWIQSIGMEWFFRLYCEPRRLWKRYFKHNPRFILFFGWQLFKHKVFKHKVFKR